MASEIARIVRQLEKAFDAQPWYGPSVISTLKEVDESIIYKHAGQAHSIIELVLHMTAWRRFVIKRLAGESSYEVSDALNFPTPSTAKGAWTKAVDDLIDIQKELVTAMKKLPEEKLGELVPGASHKYTWYTLLHGIIHHDVYHLGQISLLRKAFQ
jgi:uncharacterized damage-inducible protein DinB